MFNCVLNPRASMQAEKGQGGGGDLVPEMLLTLPLTFIVTQIWLLFRRRILRDYLPIIMWLTLLIASFAKERTSKSFRQLRCITIMSHIGKWFMGALLLIIQ